MSKFDIIWPVLNMTSVKSIWMVLQGQMTITIDVCEREWPWKHVLRDVLVTFISSDSLWPDIELCLFKYDIGTHAAPFLDTYQHFDEIELLVVNLIDFRAQNVITGLFYIDLN